MVTLVVRAPAELGRGVVVARGGVAPEGWRGAERVTVDDATLRDGAAALAVLQRHWSQRIPIVVEIACDVDELRTPESTDVPPFSLSPGFEFAKDRIYFLARANNYDDRNGRMLWSPTLEARRLGAHMGGLTDATLPDGRSVWLDGGPRTTHAGLTVVHRNTLEQHSLVTDADDATGADLSPDQLAAVQHAGGPARIVAPAGSGKTRVLTERFRLLVAHRRWSPASITAVAYNVRAKDTMRERLSDLSDASRDRIRTLHSLGNMVLHAAVGDATLIDEWDMRRRIETLVPVKPRANTDVYAPYVEALGIVRLGLVDPDHLAARRDDIDGFAGMFHAYRARLRADHAVDHDEQIYGAIETLLREPAIRQRFQNQCRHLLVDEFQDLTAAQLLMLRLLAAPAYDVFGVGDDDQVIYGYAGADPEYLINYNRYFPGGAHHALERNYRCPNIVVRATRNLLSYNRHRIDKHIAPAKTVDDADGLSVARTSSAQLAIEAVEHAKGWLADGARADDVAVLSRVNASLLPVQLLFADAGIPCWTPVSITVLNRTGTRTALAYLRCGLAAANRAPFHGPDIATALRRPSRSIRREVLQRFERRRDWSMTQLRVVARGLNATAADKFDVFCDELSQLAHAIETRATTGELLRRIRDSIGLGAALATLDISGKGPDASHRDDLNALIAVATLRPEPEAFEPWLRSRLRAADQPPRTDGVAVSTVHRVKGMEWPYVVVLGAHDGMMPHTLADDLEEERRIFHVAITRADTAVHVIADQHAAAPFLEQLDTPAPVDYVAPIRQVTEKRPATTTAPPPTEALVKVINALKVWRKQRAAADEVPAFVVLSDTHLGGIATRAPTTLDELARCAGIGPTKLERYGDEIVAVISEVT